MATRIRRKSSDARNGLLLKSLALPEIARSHSRARHSISPPGPAALPLEVLEQVRDELTDWRGSGMSVMEVSHRSKAFIGRRRSRRERICASCSRFRPNYKVLFLQGGATGQFAAIPMNLAARRRRGRLRQHRRLVEEGDRRGEALLPRSMSPATRPHPTTRTVPQQASLEADRRRRLSALHAERDHRRRGVSLCSANGRRAAGGRHVLDHSVAADRCLDASG